jgi:hypothetical protein
MMKEAPQFHANAALTSTSTECSNSQAIFVMTARWTFECRGYVTAVPQAPRPVTQRLA